ncbi:unnamed protein product [Aureobasidium uvarum]|uniref:Uncharacterized protein n=1 Tax=Aureobasidium uvarum TaxID=2773716 RepID=A0A9N8KSG5_9PEZI|nr:unnamed protein product [Aureobasidium uvarum]
MQPPSILSLVVFFTFILGIDSSPVLHERATSKCTPEDIATVRRTVKDEAYFCNWWLSETRTQSPFVEFSPLQVTDLCRCISPAKTTTKNKRAETTEATVEARLERRQTMATCRAELSIQFSQPWRFCVFYTSYPRTTSPFAGYSAQELTKLCGCVSGNVVSTFSKKTMTSTKSTSRTGKPVSKASSSSKFSSTLVKPVTKVSSLSKLSSSSIKPISRPSSTSSKLTSSSSKPISKASSSSKARSTSVKPITKASSSSRLLSSSIKPISKTFSSSSKLRSSSSRLVSKTTSSSKAATKSTLSKSSSGTHSTSTPKSSSSSQAQHHLKPETVEQHLFHHIQVFRSGSF